MNRPQGSRLPPSASDRTRCARLPCTGQRLHLLEDTERSRCGCARSKAGEGGCSGYPAAQELSQGTPSTPSVPPPPTIGRCVVTQPQDTSCIWEQPGQASVWGTLGGHTRPPSPASFFSPRSLSTGLPCLKRHSRCGLPRTRRQQITVAPCPPSILQHRAYLVYLNLSLRRTWLWGYRCATGPWPGRDGCLPSAACHSGVQARALGDTQLGHLLSTGGVDAHGPHHLRIGGSTPAHGDGGFRSRVSAGWRVHILPSLGR